MQQRSLIILALAIALGLAAVFIVNIFLTGKESQQAAQKVTYARVAVARIPLEFGAELTADKVRFVNLPTTAIPAGSYRTIGQLLPGGKRRVALRSIAINEPILATKISGEGGRASISEILNPAMRAAAVRVSDVGGVGGLILPGDTVDVIVAREISGNGGKANFADILLQNIRVLAMDQNIDEDSAKPALSKTATLEVSQVDAQKLALAHEVGTLSLVLRNVTDQDNPTVQTVSSEDLRDMTYSGAFTSPGPRYVPTMIGGGGGGSGAQEQRLVISAPGLTGSGSSGAMSSAAIRRATAGLPAGNVPMGSPLDPSGALGTQLLPFRGGNRTSVEIVRGTKGSNYEVERNGY